MNEDLEQVKRQFVRDAETLRCAAEALYEAALEGKLALNELSRAESTLHRINQLFRRSTNT